MDTILTFSSPELLFALGMLSASCLWLLQKRQARKAKQDGISAEELRTWILDNFIPKDGEIEHEQKVNRIPVSLLNPHSVEVRLQTLPGGLEGPGAACGIVLEGLLTRDECKNIIEYTENVGYGLMGTANTGRAYRGNTRCMCIDEDGSLTKAIWKRVKSHVPERITFDDKTWVAFGLNDHYRFARYAKGQGFARHVDKQTVIERTHQTLLTVNIYLNDLNEEERGRTRFYGKRGGFGKPVCAAGGVSGSAAIFPQTYDENISPWHDGDKLRGGLKYLMRTDVMYKPL